MQWERPKTVFARKALTGQGWEQDVCISIDNDVIIHIEKSAVPAGVPSFDLVLPGMANVHSHAFQRAMVGLTEQASSSGKDNFWSWREVMYKFLDQLTPEHVEIIARAFYIDCLKHGYTAVGEFHYLHNDISGKSYASPTELSDRVIAAAIATGIHIAHLPVMYETSNFGGIPANDGQKRFVHTADSFMSLLEMLRKKYEKTEGVSFGVAPHSLRAVTPETLQRIIAGLPKDFPIHIHAAEQEKEVADSLAASGKRPVEWLLDNHDINKRWCLVHATHMTPAETVRLAKSGAVVGLCPTTEGNLGDGIFPGEAYFKAGGNIAIGSDSNVCVSPWEELRMMEYAQRLSFKKRNVLCDEATPSVGRSLFTRAAKSGAQALAFNSGQIAAGYRADFIAVSTENALLAGKKDDAILDTLIFAVPPLITDVFVAGKRVVKNGVHALEEESIKKLSNLALLKG